MENKTITTIGLCLQRLIYITNNILDIQMIRQKKFETNPTEICLEERIMEIIEMIDPEIDSRELEIRLKISEELKRNHIQIDSNKLG